MYHEEILLYEHPEHQGGELGVVGEQIPQLLGEAQDELLYRDLREYILCQVEGHFFHAAAHAGGAKAAPFAGERDGEALFAIIAFEPHKTVRQDAAPDVSLKLLLYVAWEGLMLRESREGVEGGLNRLVEEGRLWITGLVFVCWSVRAGGDHGGGSSQCWCHWAAY